MNLSQYHDTIKSFMKNMLLESQVVSQRHLLVTKEKFTKVNLSDTSSTM